VAEVLIDFGLQLVTEGRQALGDGVGILAGADGVDAGFFD
jgi:hypothetical protein